MCAGSGTVLLLAAAATADSIIRTGIRAVRGDLTIRSKGGSLCVCVCVIICTGVRAVAGGFGGTWICAVAGSVGAGMWIDVAGSGTVKQGSVRVRGPGTARLLATTTLVRRYVDQCVWYGSSSSRVRSERESVRLRGMVWSGRLLLLLRVVGTWISVAVVVEFDPTARYVSISLTSGSCSFRSGFPSCLCPSFLLLPTLLLNGSIIIGSTIIPTTLVYCG